MSSKSVETKNQQFVKFAINKDTVVKIVHRNLKITNYSVDILRDSN